MKEILKSVRFQQMAVAVVLAVAMQAGWLGDGFIETLGTMVTAIAALSVGIGTVDKLGESIGKRN